MNTFAINLALLSDREIPTSRVLSLRSSAEGMIEIVLLTHKPGPSGGKRSEESLGRVHELDLVRRLCPQTLLLAREAVAWGPTGEVLTDERLGQASLLSEGWVQDAHLCHQHVGEAA